MKKIIVCALFAFFSIDIFAQNGLPVIEGTGQVGYEEVVTAGDFSAKLIYFSALKFYKSRAMTEDVVIQDEDLYMIAGPMVVTLGYLGKGMPVLFNCDMQFKDGRYKYTFTDFVVDTNGGGKIDLSKPWPKHMAGKGKIPAKTMEEMESLIAEMKAYIEKDLKTGDW